MSKVDLKRRLLSSRDVSSLPLVEHFEDQAMCAPREVIRGFLEKLLEVAQVSCSVEALRKSSALFGGCFRRIRAMFEALMEEEERKGRLSREAKLGLRLLVESSLSLLWLEGTQPPDWPRPSPLALRCLGRRPRPHLFMDQLYCTLDSTERRVLEVFKALPRGDAKVLFLGDDDLGSLLMASLLRETVACGEHDDLAVEVHIVDFDPRLLAHIAEAAPEVHVHKLDLIQGGVPRDFYRAFDAVILDPPWDAYGAWNFLDKALYCLRPSPTSRIFLSFCPVYLEYAQQKLGSFWRRMERRGLSCLQLARGFHLYALDGTEFFELLLHHLSGLDSPLWSCLMQVPYGFSHLYTLQWEPARGPGPLLERWLRWWHQGDRPS